MKIRYVMLGMAILAMLLFYSISIHTQSASISGANINSSISSTAAFINKVNQSGYLIFYPNLTAAYNYLQLAKENSQSGNITSSYILLAKAQQSAQLQLDSMDQYKSDSLYILIVSSILLAIILYMLMITKKSPKGKTKIAHT
jgi:hypothetical protein